MSRVAVWVNNFGNAPYVARCMDSVLAQTHKDFTCYVFDNNSTDGARDIFYEYQRKYPDTVKVMTMPEGLAGIPAMKFGWDYINGVGADYSITIGGHDFWGTPDFLERLVHRMDHEMKYRKVAIVYPDTYQVDLEGRLCGKFDNILQLGGAIPAIYLPQFLIPGLDCPPFFGLWNESIRRQVPVRYPCSGFDHLVIIEAATLHGAMLYEPAILTMQAPRPGTGMAQYGRKHLDKQRLKDKDRDFLEQLAWISLILDAAVEKTKNDAQSHTQMMLLASLALTYINIRGYNLFAVPDAYEKFSGRPAVQAIVQGAQHIATHFRKLAQF